MQKEPNSRLNAILVVPPIGPPLHSPSFNKEIFAYTIIEGTLSALEKIGFHHVQLIIDTELLFLKNIVYKSRPWSMHLSFTENMELEEVVKNYLNQKPAPGILLFKKPVILNSETLMNIIENGRNSHREIWEDDSGLIHYINSDFINKYKLKEKKSGETMLSNKKENLKFISAVKNIKFSFMPYLIRPNAGLSI